MTDKIHEKSINTENRLKSKLYSRMPEYIFSNDLFENWIKESLKLDTIWVDAGCGKNSLVYEFENLAPNGTGIDVVEHPERSASDKKFINASLEKIPFEDSSVDVIISNMVVEHIENIEKVMSEYYRILKTEGSFIFRTTNKFYPTLLAGHLFPKKLKDKIIYSLFGVKSHDVFETRYPMNTLKKIKTALPSYGFNIFRIEAVEDLHLFHPIAFELSYGFYKIQTLNSLRWLRNCIVCWATKSNKKLL